MSKKSNLLSLIRLMRKYHGGLCSEEVDDATAIVDSSGRSSLGRLFSEASSKPAIFSIDDMIA